MPKLALPSGSGRVPSAPYDTEGARSLLQVRLAQYERLGMITGFFFLVLAVIMRFVLPLEGSNAAILAQVGSTSLGAVTWLAMRRGSYRTSTRYAVDFAATVGICAVFIALGWGLPLWARPELVQLVCITDILGLRAFLVPSSTRRTAIDEAHAWWQSHESALRARHDARVRALSTFDRERTVAVNWRARTEPARG